MSGLLSGEFHLTGEYERPVGFGAMTIDDGVAYGEPFQKATSPLRFDGTGVRLDDMNIAKDTGTDHRRRLRRVGLDLLVQCRRAPHSGGAARRSGVSAARRCRASPSSPRPGSGTFESPRNDFRFRVNDLFVGEEGVGAGDRHAGAARQPS